MFIYLIGHLVVLCFCISTGDGILDISWELSQNLERWYQPWELCILNSTSAEDLMKITKECTTRHGVPLDGLKSFKCRAGGLHNSKHLCQSYPGKVQRDRVHYFQAVKGYDNPDRKPLRELYELYSYTNTSMMFFGDSMMKQIFHAHSCELEREELMENSSMIENVFVNEVYETNLLPPTQVIFLKQFKFSASALKKFRLEVTKLAQKSDRVVIVLNQGLHFNENLKEEFSSTLEHAIKEHFSRMNDAFSTKSFVFIYLETAAQHFETAGIDTGYYSNKTSISRDKCIPVLESAKDWRNELLHTIIDDFNNNKGDQLPTFTLNIFPMRRLTRPLHDMHLYSSKYGVDCTHFCWTPMMWQPLWTYILDAVRCSVNPM